MSLLKPPASAVERSGVSKKSFSETFPTFAGVGGMSKKVGRRLRFLWRPRLILRLLAVLAVAYTGFNIYASVLLNRELAEIRAKGQPLQMSEIAPPAVPDVENAALVYQRAYKAISDIRKVDEVMSHAFEPGSKNQSEVIELLRKNQKPIALIRRAASMPKCRFQINWKGSPLAVRFPQYAHQRSMSRILSAQAKWEAQSGDIDAALRDVRCVYGMARQFQYEPVLIGCLVSYAIDATAAETLDHVLTTVPSAASQGKRFLQTLPRINWDRSFEHAFWGERTFSIWAFANIPSSPNPFLQNPDSGSASLMAWVTAPLWWLWKPFAKMDEVFILRVWKHYIGSISSMPVPAPPKYYLALQHDLDSAPPYAIFTRMLFPVFARSRDNRDRIEVTDRMSEVALALSAYKAKYKSYPNSLTQAAAIWDKSLPSDPYSGKPFHYRMRGQQFFLYSIGTNRTDDGGYTYPDRSNISRVGNEITDDIVWGKREVDKFWVNPAP